MHWAGCMWFSCWVRVNSKVHYTKEQLVPGYKLNLAVCWSSGGSDGCMPAYQYLDNINNMLGVHNKPGHLTSCASIDLHQTANACNTLSSAAIIQQKIMAGMSKVWRNSIWSDIWVLRTMTANEPQHNNIHLCRSERLKCLVWFTVGVHQHFTIFN